MTNVKVNNLRERVVGVASELFQRSGLRAVRMDDVARECGISKRTLYEIFEDREQLIRECMLLSSRQSHERSAQATEGAENVLHAFWLIFSQNRQQHNVDVAIIQELQRYYPDVFRDVVVDIHEKTVADTRRELQKGVDDGLIMASLDLEFFSRALTNYIYGLGMIELNTATTGVNITEHTMPSAVLIFLRGISTEKGREYIDNKFIK